MEVKMYPSYLIHFNKNHSKKNGQFISGDGDGDGTADEHHRYTDYGKGKEVTVGNIRKITSYHPSTDKKYRKNLERVDKYRAKADNEFEQTEYAKKLKAEMFKANSEFGKYANEYWKKGKYITDPKSKNYGNVVFEDKKWKQEYDSASKKQMELVKQYYTQKGEYVCKKMLKSLSAYDVSSYGMGWDLPTEYKGSVDSLIKNYGEQYIWSYRDEEIYW